MTPRFLAILLCSFVFACAADESSDDAADAVAATPDATDNADAPTDGNPAAALTRLNEQRLASGIGPVSVSDALSEGCAAHARYMADVQKVIHEEDPARAEFTAAGAAAGPNAVIAGAVESLDDAVERWLADPYQRLGLLDPGVGEVGLGFEQGYACLDVFSSYSVVEEHPPVPWPAPDQIDVPAAFLPDGAVHPIPADVDLPTGPVVSLMFANGRSVDRDFSVVFLREDSGAAVEDVFVRLPRDDNDPYAAFQLNAVSAATLSPLDPDRTYRVIFKGDVDGAYYEKQWTFTTAP